MTSNLKLFSFFDDDFYAAISFTTFWTMCLSSWSLSEGVIYMWKALFKIEYYIVFDVPSGFNILSSSWRVRDETWYSYLIKDKALVFLPAPVGPYRIRCYVRIKIQGNLQCWLAIEGFGWLKDDRRVRQGFWVCTDQPTKFRASGAKFIIIRYWKGCLLS